MLKESVYFKDIILKKILYNANSLYFCHFGEYSAKELAVLKSKLKKEGFFFKVVKASGLPAKMPAVSASFFKPFLKGPCALIYSFEATGKETPILKILKENKNLFIFAAYLDGIFFNRNRVSRFASGNLVKNNLFFIRNLKNNSRFLASLCGNKHFRNLISILKNTQSRRV